FWLSVSDETRRLKKAPMGIDAATRKINAGLLKIPSNIPKPETKTAMTLANPSTMNRRGCLSCRSGEKATIANAVTSGEKKMISWRNSIILFTSFTEVNEATDASQQLARRGNPGSNNIDTNDGTR